MFYFSRGMRIYSLVDGDLSSEWASTNKALRKGGRCHICHRTRHAVVPIHFTEEDWGLCMCPKKDEDNVQETHEAKTDSPGSLFLASKRPAYSGIRFRTKTRKGWRN